MIEEPELRELFAAEAAQALERIERGLLALERSPHERPLIESVFRQAHSLKGSAASLGLSAVESLAHRFEDALDGARQGRSLMTPEGADQLYRALDALRGLVDEAVTGRPCGVDLTSTLAGLSRASAGASQPPKDDAKPPGAFELPGSSHEERSSLEAEPLWETNSSSVRVETVRLDSALADTGDLVVTSARLGLRRVEAQGIWELQEAWVRDWRLRGGGSRGDGERLAQIGTRLEHLIRLLADDQARLETITEHLRDEIQAMRLLPLHGLFNRFPRVVRDLARQEGKRVEMVLEGGETTADRRLLESLHAPLMHLIRNAVDHGVESPSMRERQGKPERATLRLSAVRRGPALEISLSDDGSGLDLRAVSRRALELRLRTEEQLSQASEADLRGLVFVPGFSTRSEVSDLSGRGTGLDAVRAAVEALGGTIVLESWRGTGTVFRLRLPQTLATSQVMVCSCGERLFAIPLGFVERSLMFNRADVFHVEGRPCLEVGGALVPVCALDDVLGGSSAGEAICLILSDRTDRHGFVVEDLLGVMEIVVKPFLESRLVGGASILPDGRVCLVLQPTEVLRQAREVAAPLASRLTEAVGKGDVLLVEDSAVPAAQAQRLLETAGYRVILARNGAEGWDLACRRQFQAVVSDIEMPLLDGLELTRRLRGVASYAAVPILLVTSRAGEETRLNGLEAGASAYLEKSSYEDGSFLRILERLL